MDSSEKKIPYQPDLSVKITTSLLSCISCPKASWSDLKHSIKESAKEGYTYVTQMQKVRVKCLVDTHFPSKVKAHLFHLITFT